MSSDGLFADPATYNLDAYRWVLFESDFVFDNGEVGEPGLCSTA